ncbi:MAG: hypothetical protein V2I63_00275 [Pseudomonadales bacterium]|jgi:hypothetical protein|nr:hypothetical protein [Pseudomonadales bacterium]
MSEASLRQLRRLEAPLVVFAAWLLVLALAARDDGRPLVDDGALDTTARVVVTLP